MDEPRNSSRPAKAHDLRHQLALLAVDIRLCRDRLARREGGPGLLLPSLLDRLERGLERAKRIILEGAPPLSIASVDRSELVLEIWDRFLRAGRLSSETSTLDLSRPWFLPGSESSLHALLLNLLENACKAAPEGPVRLILDGEGLLIENGGEPLPEDLGTMLNEGRAPEATGEQGWGLGEILGRACELGLALSVETGALTRLRFTRERGPHILLIEDDDSLRAMLSELLRRDGFKVDEASSFAGLGKDAGPWVAAIADLGLPEEAGDHGLARIKRSHPDTRTLLLTGARERAAELHEGVDRVIVKPGLAVLQDELRILLERAR